MVKLTKEKIAISLDKSLLTLIDSTVDGTTVRSRSQAIETLVRQGLSQEYVHDAVILIKKDHQRLLLEQVQGKPLLLHHLKLLEQANVKRCFLVTSQSSTTDALLAAVKGKTKIQFSLINEEKPQGNIAALQLVREYVGTNFIVFLGDTLNAFDLKKMILFHLEKGRIATVGLITHPKPNLYSSVELEGDRIVAFRNKKKSESYVIDAGVYVFNKTLFEFFRGDVRFFEKDVLGKLCSLDQINGFFTYGKYTHFGE